MGLGAFIIIITACAVPVVAILLYYEAKAKKLQVLAEKPKRTAWESVKYYVVEFDGALIPWVC